MTPIESVCMSSVYESSNPNPRLNSVPASPLLWMLRLSRVPASPLLQMLELCVPALQTGEEELENDVHEQKRQSPWVKVNSMQS